MTTVTELRFFNGFCDFLMNFCLLLGAPFAFCDLIFVYCKCAQAVKELSHDYFVMVGV
jgi:hypothetical protein